jgi:glycosyltransferase involved in cell wall biosynthesis
LSEPVVRNAQPPAVRKAAQAAAPQPLPAVLFVNLSRTWGGGEQWHFAMSQALAARGWPVELLVWPRSPLAEQAGAAGLARWPLALRTGSLFNPLKLARLSRGLARRRPGAVILNGSHELKTAGVLAHLSGVPKVILRRGIPLPLSPGWINGWLLRHAVTRLITNSQATLDAMQGGFPGLIEPLRPRVIYNGVDPAGFVPPASRTPTARIVIVGRLEWEKGVDLALAAFARLRQHVPRAKLRIVGDGSERQALEELAERLGVREAVEFTGPTRRVADMLRDADVLVLASRWEGFGFVLVEAMLMELATVSFDLPAAREIVVDGMTGLLAPEGDVEALSAALTALLTAPARMRDLGKAGRLRALSNFTLDRSVSELEHVLLEPVLLKS